MNAHPQPIFHLSLLSALLLSGFAYADNTASQNLPTITVKAQAVQSTHRVTTKNLDETTSTELKEVLFNEPSVNFGGGHGTAQWTTIRGMGQDQIDIKVDNTYSDSQMFHHNGRFIFDPALVKVIGVQKGAGSASAGIGATSGAIVSKTIDAKDLLRDGQNAGFKLNAGINSNKGYSRGATVYGRYNGLDAIVSGSWVKRDDYKAGKGYRALDGSERLHNSGLGQRGLLAKFGYNFNDDQRIVLSHRQEKTYGTRNLREEFDFAQSWQRQGRGANAPLVLDDNGNPIPNTANNHPNYRILTRDTTNLEYTGKNMGLINKAQANVYSTMLKRTEKNNNASQYANKLHTLGVNLDLDSILLDRHTIKYGLNWRKQEMKPTCTVNKQGGCLLLPTPRTTKNEQKTDTGIYVEGIWDFEPVTLTTGLRYDRFQANYSDGKKFSGSNLNPSVGVIYDVNQDLSFNAHLNYATRSPRLGEGMVSGGWLAAADTNLKAERARNAEIGVKYKLKDGKLNVEGNYFWQNIKDVQAAKDITLVTAGNNKEEFTLFYNGGTLKNHGYELSLSSKWQNWKVRAGVAYNKPKMHGVSLDSIVTAVPMGRTWTTGLSYQFDRPNVEIGWSGRFVQASQYDGASVSQRGANATSTRRAGYGVHNLYANWKPTGKDDWNVNVSVNNVGNKYYKSHSQRESGSGNSLPAHGRDFRLAVNYRF